MLALNWLFGLPQIDPIVIEVPSPEPCSSDREIGVPGTRNLRAVESSPSRKRKGDELIHQLLGAQQETTAQTKRIADTLDQLLLEMKRNKEQ